jgi:hypothetical protein
MFRSAVGAIVTTQHACPVSSSLVVNTSLLPCSKRRAQTWSCASGEVLFSAEGTGKLERGFCGRTPILVLKSEDSVHMTNPSKVPLPRSYFEQWPQTLLQSTSGEFPVGEDEKGPSGKTPG